LLFVLFNASASAEIYPLSLLDALPICGGPRAGAAAPRPEAGQHHARRPGPRPADRLRVGSRRGRSQRHGAARRDAALHGAGATRSEEHTSELQSLAYLVCRLLLEKKKQ